MNIHIHTQEPSSDVFAALSPEAVADEAARRMGATEWGPKSRPGFENSVREERLAAAFRRQLATYSHESLLRDVKGDLVDAASRYIGNDILCQARSNPQIACDAHMALSDLWLNVVAGKAIEGERDAKGKLAALLHYLHADDMIELPADIEIIVDQLRAHEAGESA